MLPVEMHGLLQRRRCTRLSLRSRQGLGEGGSFAQLDESNDVAAAPATMTIEHVLARVHEKRGPRFPMQRTQSRQLAALLASQHFPAVLF
jgi:hypothetical protein